MERRIIENDELPAIDQELFKRMRTESTSENERLFFERMEEKELREFPVSSFDVILSERDNNDGIYIVKCYYSEYLIGKRDADGSAKIDYVPSSLSEALATDLFPLIKEHITLLEWLRKRDYLGLRYDYEWEE